MRLYYGNVTRVTGTWLHVTVEDLGGDADFDPLPAVISLCPDEGDVMRETVYEKGDRVVVGQVGRIKEDLVVLGRIG